MKKQLTSAVTLGLALICIIIRLAFDVNAALLAACILVAVNISLRAAKNR